MWVSKAIDGVGGSRGRAGCLCTYGRKPLTISGSINSPWPNSNTQGDETQKSETGVKAPRGLSSLCTSSPPI